MRNFAGCVCSPQCCLYPLLYHDNFLSVTQICARTFKKLSSVVACVLRYRTGISRDADVYNQNEQVVKLAIIASIDRGIP